MKTVYSRSAIVASLFLCAHAFAQQPQQKLPQMTVPPPPPPVKEALPLNAKVTPTGVSIPIRDSKTWTIEMNKLPNPQPGEKGGTLGVGKSFK